MTAKNTNGNRRIGWAGRAAAAAVILWAVQTTAQGLDTLKESFKARYPAVQELKKAGKVGETMVGLIEATKPEFAADAAVSRVVEDENRDRKALYQSLAQQEKTAPEKIAERNAARNFQRAMPGELLKDAAGKWQAKK
jgi:uncharacterized protein YdbL (DUF1318 family)